jgi:phasin
MADMNAAARDAVNGSADAARSAMGDAFETMNRSMGAWQARGLEMPELFRSMSETGITQARDTYVRLKTAAEEATDAMEESFEATRAGLVTLQNKALDAAERNSAATFGFLRSLLGVTSAADAVQLQTSFARERFEAFVDYAKDVQTTMAQVTQDASRPARAAMGKAAGETRTAA